MQGSLGSASGTLSNDAGSLSGAAQTLSGNAGDLSASADSLSSSAGATGNTAAALSTVGAEAAQRIDEISVDTDLGTLPALDEIKLGDDLQQALAGISLPDTSAL